MNTRIEAALMISAGTLFTAGAGFGPTLGGHLSNMFVDAAKGQDPVTAQTAPQPTPVWVDEAAGGNMSLGLRVLPCQDTVSTQRSSGSATISTHDDRGGYSITIVDGQLQEINADGDYTFEEDGDIVRILDPGGGVAFETSKTNPSLGAGDFVFHSFGDVFTGQPGASSGAVLTPAPPSPPAPRAQLGVRVSPPGAAMAAQLGIDDGALVEFIAPGSGADAGGLQQFDVIMGVDGVPIGARTLGEIISDREPGDTVRVDLIRNGKRRSADVTLDQAPAEAPMPEGLQFQIGSPWELDRLLQALMFELDRRDSQGPQMQRFPGVAPAPPALRPAPPAPKNPDATDASELAPKAHTRSAPA